VTRTEMVAEIVHTGGLFRYSNRALTPYL